jgi:hypothetical protein
MGIYGDSNSYTSLDLFLSLSSLGSIPLGLSVFPHSACIRPGLAWSLAKFPQFWNPRNAESRKHEGLGAYTQHEDNNPGSFLGPPLTDDNVTQLQRVSFKVAWQEAWGPYAGMQLPWMPTNESWWIRNNDPTRQNYTYVKCNEMVASYPARGFTMLSYFNLFEFGHGMPETV